MAGEKRRVRIQVSPRDLRENPELMKLLARLIEDEIGGGKDVHISHDFESPRHDKNLEPDEQASARVRADATDALEDENRKAGSQAVGGSTPGSVTKLLKSMASFVGSTLAEGWKVTIRVLTGGMLS